MMILFNVPDKVMEVERMIPSTLSKGVMSYIA